MIKIGTLRDSIRKNKKKGYWAYSDIETDKDGWADASKFLPADCDLVYLRTENDKTKKGWHCGNQWDGLHLSKKDVIKFWKYKREYNFACH